jgi:hypothetical protein
MENSIRKKIEDAVDNLYKTDFEKFRRDTYWDNYRLVKSLNLGHRPTKEETDSVMFYSVAKLIGKGNANDGIQRVLDQTMGIPLED